MENANLLSLHLKITITVTDNRHSYHNNRFGLLHVAPKRLDKIVGDKQFPVFVSWTTVMHSCRHHGRPDTLPPECAETVRLFMGTRRRDHITPVLR